MYIATTTFMPYHWGTLRRGLYCRAQLQGLFNSNIEYVILYV
jgi:hypothetical protein